jgi:hypothetical protein
VLAVRPRYWPSPPEPLRSTPRAATACASPPLARCLEPPPQRPACAPPGPASRRAPCASVRPRVPCLGQLLVAHAPARAARTRTSLGAAAPAARARSPRCASSRPGPCACRYSSTACSSPGPPAPALPRPLALTRAAQRPSRSPCQAARRPASAHSCRPRPASAHCRRPRALGPRVRVPRLAWGRAMRSASWACCLPACRRLGARAWIRPSVAPGCSPDLLPYGKERRRQGKEMLLPVEEGKKETAGRKETEEKDEQVSLRTYA